MASFSESEVASALSRAATKLRIQHAAPPARKSSQGICAGKGRVCEPSNWQREVTLLLCCSISAYSYFYGLA